MEEPPKIECIVASQGISIYDTSTILKSYLSSLDQYHKGGDEHADSMDDTKPSADEEGGEDTEEGGDSSKTPPRKSREERQEEALIAQMDQLVNGNSSSGMISDDVYERLKMITKSITAEAEGRTISAASGTASKSGIRSGEEVEEEVQQQEDDSGANEFLAELEEAEKLQQEEETEQNVEQTNRDKKKAKKAKKAAKKAKKEAKRKARESEGANDSKRVKLE